jgi:HK97 gp10 family phage protein
MAVFVRSNRLPGIRRAIGPATMRGLDRLGRRMRDKARLYSLPKDTGALWDSIVYQIVETGDGATLYVGSDSDHAVYVNFGTTRMPARLFLNRAVAEERPSVGAALADEYRAILGGV